MIYLLDLFAPIGNQVSYLITCDTDNRGGQMNQAIKF